MKWIGISFSETPSTKLISYPTFNCTALRWSLESTRWSFIFLRILRCFVWPQAFFFEGEFGLDLTGHQLRFEFFLYASGCAIAKNAVWDTHRGSTGFPVVSIVPTKGNHESTSLPRVALFGIMTSFGWAFLHSTWNTEKKDSGPVTHFQMFTDPSIRFNA